MTFGDYCSCPIARDCPAVYPTLLINLVLRRPFKNKHQQQQQQPAAAETLITTTSTGAAAENSTITTIISGNFSNNSNNNNNINQSRSWNFNNNNNNRGSSGRFNNDLEMSVGGDCERRTSGDGQVDDLDIGAAFAVNRDDVEDLSVQIVLGISADAGDEQGQGNAKVLERKYGFKFILL